MLLLVEQLLLSSAFSTLISLSGSSGGESPRCFLSYQRTQPTPLFYMGRSSSSRRFSDQGSRACFFHFFCWFTRGGSARCTTLAHEATDQAFARTLASCAWTWSVFFASWGTKSCDLLSRLGSGDKWAGWEGGCPDCGTPCRLVIGVGLCKDCWSVGVWLVQARGRFYLGIFMAPMGQC